MGSGEGDGRPSDRSSEAEIAAGVEHAAREPVVQALLRLHGGPALVLDRHLQAVGASASALKLLGRERASDILGLRLGEAIGCVHARDHSSGCGWGPTCASCGAAIAMIEATRNARPEEAECFLAVDRGGPRDLNLRVRAAPLDSDPPLLVVALSDLAPERSRAALERGLLSDFADMVAALAGLTDHLVPRLSEELGAAGVDLQRLAARFVAELEIQRALTTSSPSGCGLATEVLPLHEVLQHLHDGLRRHEVTGGRALVATARAGVRTVVANRPVLERVLTCLLVNALEATPEGGEVRLEVAEERSAVVFRVWNAGAMPAAAAARVFQRYFTTKEGPARGHGTFLAKVLTERVLGGELGFSSSPYAGTTFHLRVPVLGKGGQP